MSCTEWQLAPPQDVFLGRTTVRPELVAVLNGNGGDEQSEAVGSLFAFALDRSRVGIELVKLDDEDDAQACCAAELEALLPCRCQAPQLDLSRAADAADVRVRC